MNFIYQALTNGQTVTGQTKLLWADSSTGWELNTEHEFSIKHRPTAGIINVQIKIGGSTIIDTGDIQVDGNSGISGGRVGVLGIDQPNVFWSDLSYGCEGNKCPTLFLTN